MKHLTLSLLLCCLAQTASAQPCPQAAQIRSDLQSAYDAGFLDKAFESVKALRACDSASDQEADRWTDRIFAEIKNQKRRAEDETNKTLSELKQTTSNFWLSEAKNHFDKSFTFEALSCLLKAREAWDGNAQARVMLDSMPSYCPDWTVMTSRYVGFSSNETVMGYYDETTKNGGLCDYVLRDIKTGDTTVFRQVNYFSFYSMSARFSADGNMVVYYTNVDTSGWEDKATINIYNRAKKKTFRFPQANILENWFSDNGRMFVFLTEIPNEKDYANLYVFDFETEQQYPLGKCREASGDWRFWISPDGEHIAYCIDLDTVTTQMEEMGIVALWNLKNKLSRTFKSVFLHAPNFSSDSRYLVLPNSPALPGIGSLVDLNSGKEQKGFISTTAIKGYSGLVAIRMLDFGKGRKISTYDPIKQIWSVETMPKELRDYADMEFISDMLIYSCIDSNTGSARVGVFNSKKNIDFIFSDNNLASIRFYNIRNGLNKSKNNFTLVNENKRTIRFYDFEDGKIRNFENATMPDNRIRNEYLGVTSDDGAFLWMIKSNVVSSYGFELCLVNRSGNVSIIDSGDFNLAFFVETNGKTKAIYVPRFYNSQRAQYEYELVLLDPNTGSRTRLKAHGSNQLSSDRNDFTDLWHDELRQLLVYSPSPKTFCVWDLASNKAIRTFKIEQEYQSIELRGTSGSLEITFKNGIKKWIQIDAPARALQWHIERLGNRK